MADFPGFDLPSEQTDANQTTDMADFFDLPAGNEGYDVIEEKADIGFELQAEPVPEKAEEQEEEEEEEEEDEEEITFLSIWQEKRNAQLAEKAEKERQDKIQAKEDARTALESFYKNREEQIANIKQQNRQAQEAFQETIYEADWHGVSQILGDSLTKPTPGMAGHADKSNRYRKLLIQLSHERN